MNLVLIISGLLFNIGGVIFLTWYSDRQLVRIFKNVVRADDEFLANVGMWIHENKRASIFGIICLFFGFLFEFLGNLL